MLHDEMCRQGNSLFRYRSYLPLLLVPLGIWNILHYKRYISDSHNVDLMFDLACLGLGLIGSAIRFVSLGFAQSGTSGRNTRSGQVADALNVKGMYSLCRHPLYLGNMIIYTSVLLFTKSPWFASAGVLGLYIYYERIISTEESFLHKKFGEAYRTWADTVPCLIPRFRGWIAPSIPFSFRAGLRSEAYSLAGLVVTFYVLDAIEHYVIEGRFRTDLVWDVLLGLSLFMFLVVRFMRKHTRILSEPAVRIEA